MKDNNFYKNILILLAFMILGAIIGSLLSLMLVKPIFHVDIFENLNILSLDKSNEQYAPIIKFIQFVQVIFVFIIPAQLFAYFKSNGNTNEYLSITKPKTLFVLFALLLIFLSSPFISYLSVINESVVFPESLASIENYFRSKEIQAAAATEIMLTANTITDLFVNILIIGFLAAFSEEILFRGLLQKLLINKIKNVHVAIWLTAFIFSAFHLQFFGFIPRLFLGVFLGYAFYFSKSIWIPILMHFMNNTVAVVIDYLYKHQLTSINPNENNYFGYIGLCISIISTIIVIWYWNKTTLNIDGKKLG